MAEGPQITYIAAGLRILGFLFEKKLGSKVVNEIDPDAREEYKHLN